MAEQSWSQKLWTRIDFHEGPPYDKAKEWLARSQDCHIEVLFDVLDDSAGFMENEYILAALDILQPHVARISRLFIRISYLEEMATIIDRLTAGNQVLPLKALALLITDDDGDLMSTEKMQAKAGTLKTMLEGLEELQICKVYIPWNQVSFRGMKILKLESLHESVTPQQLYAILSVSPNLEM